MVINVVKKAIFCFLLLLVALARAETLDYRVSYLFRGDVKGVFLFIIPFRVFFEMSASADFIAHRDESNHYEFSFQRIPGPGYLFRSVGFQGKRFVFLAAGREPEGTLVFSIDKMSELTKNTPGYAKYMIDTRKVLYTIPSDQQGSMVFERSPFGKHGRFHTDLFLETGKRSRKSGVYFNIYPILVDLLKAFDHSCVPVSDLKEMDSRMVWQSPPLDLTDTLNRIGWKAAHIMEKFVVFKQSHSFRLTYRVSTLNRVEMEICGDAHPDVRVWGGFRIRDMYRRLRFRLRDSLLISDEVIVDVRNKNNSGGVARVGLELVE